jgi:predicted RNA-binding protein with PUA-like domain
MKSEPSVYSWSQLVAEKRTVWSGVRNHQANNNMKAMQLGDEAFFYHSNDERSIVGIMEIVGLWHPDPDDAAGKFGMVTVAPIKTLSLPISLTTIKSTPPLSKMTLLRQSRLSVTPVTPSEWHKILNLSTTT